MSVTLAAAARHAVRLDEQHVAAGGRPREADRDAGPRVRSATCDSDANCGRAEQLARRSVGVTIARLASPSASCRARLRQIARDPLLELAHAGLVRVAA